MNDDLLVKYMAGEADEHERGLVEAWLRQNDENARIYRRLELIWNGSAELVPEETPDEEIAWERFRERLKQADQPEMAPAPVETGVARPGTELNDEPGLPSRNWLAVAAVLTLLLVAGGIAEYLGGFWSGRTMTLHAEQVTADATLPDGTEVVLNRNSVLSYPGGFKGTTRAVTLSGEAFFDVEPDQDRPFVITVGGLEVEVTGTSFNVKSRQDLTEVIVETGSVQVRRGDEMISLQSGEKAVSASDSKLKKTPARNTLYQYYRTREFVCKGTPLQELVDVLNEAYSVHILVPDTALQQQPLTAIFRREESPDQIVKALAETFALTVRHEGEQIILER